MERLRIQPQALLLIILALLLLPWLGTTWFNSKGEPREAIVAVSILQSGNWILPVNYGGDIPFKPPFLAWLIAIFAKIFNGGNVNEYISRLPSALACVAMVWAGYRWSARLRGERFAMVMSLVTVTSVEVLRAAVVCRLDMLLTADMLIA
ncbi:MAG: glycosyltransferase family 39 protein, partial [Muribaculaceae bacterium]|nr:glycosyltransferase family 39 protein [Muribaculaceae bacterium]